MKLIRVAKPMIGREEIREVTECLRSGWLTAGPKVARLEAAMKRFLGVKNVILLTSCTAAFHLTLKALGIAKGDEVITPSLTYTSIGNVLLNLEAKPVFIDVDPKTLTLDTNQLESKITAKTKAIIPVDFAGLPAEYDIIHRIARKKRIPIIADAATSFGGVYKKRMVGTLGDFTCFSFYATKNMTTGEGGAVATDNQTVGDKIRLLSKLGINACAWNRHSARASWLFDVLQPGLKYYMTDLQAAIGLPQLKKIKKFLARRKKIAYYYYEELKNITILKSPYPTFPQNHTWNFYPMLVAPGYNRNHIMKKMEMRGVASSVYYIPLHTHTIFHPYQTMGVQLPITMDIFKRELSLPLYPGLTDSEVEKVVSVIKKLDQ